MGLYQGRVLCISIMIAVRTEYYFIEGTYLIPTPPAMKTIFRIPSRSIPIGGQTKLPPTRIANSVPRISSFGFQSHALAGFDGAYCTASSTYGALPGDTTGGTPNSL